MKTILKRGTALGTMLMLVLFVGACSNSDNAVTGTDTANATTTLSMSDIRAAVHITDAQATDVAKALQTMNNDKSSPPAPVMQFIASSAKTLDRQQLKSLIRLMADYQPQAVRGNGPRKGFGKGLHKGGFQGRGFGKRQGNLGDMNGAFADLNLTAEQKEQLRAARDEMRQTQRGLFEAVKAGTMTKEKMRDAMKALHDGFREKMGNILTDEQLAALNQKREDRMIERLKRQIAFYESGDHPQLDWLIEILDLSDDQVAEIESIHDTALARVKEVLAGLEGGTLDVAAARDAMHDINTERHGAVLNVLTDEQKDLFDELMALRHHRWGPRRGQV